MIIADVAICFLYEFVESVIERIPMYAQHPSGLNAVKSATEERPNCFKNFFWHIIEFALQIMDVVEITERRSFEQEVRNINALVWKIIEHASSTIIG